MPMLIMKANLCVEQHADAAEYVIHLQDKAPCSTEKSIAVTLDGKNP
jgi:hypothetical protein